MTVQLWIMAALAVAMVIVVLINEHICRNMQAATREMQHLLTCERETWDAILQQMRDAS